MVDLESKASGGKRGASLLVSSETTIVESIMQDKPELSKAVYDAVGGLRIGDGAKETDNDTIEVQLDMEDPSCVTGKILQRTELSKG